MSKSIKAFVSALALVTLAACGSSQPEDSQEFIVVDPEPITVEPTYNGKYK